MDAGGNTKQFTTTKFGALQKQKIGKMFYLNSTTKTKKGGAEAPPSFHC